MQGVLRQCIKCSTKEGGSSESESDSSDREESESRLPVGVRVKSQGGVGGRAERGFLPGGFQP